MRTICSLKEDWTFVKGETLTLEKGESVTLPHTWNGEDGQDGGNDYYRGSCWYFRQLEKPEIPQGYQVWLEFEGAAMSAQVYLNGEQVASHAGGFSTFRVEVTDRLQPSNQLAVKVDNSENDTVYPQKADFTFYGGLYRPVKLLLVPGAHFALGYHGGPGIKVTPMVDLEHHRAQVTVEAWVEGPGREVQFHLAGQEKAVPVKEGKAEAAFTLEEVHLWDGLEDPYLYTVTASLDSGDEISARFGCRKFEVDPQKGFLLNGRSYPLRGVAKHQDRKTVGNAVTPEMLQEDMAIIRELGANTLRLAHYQHAQEFYDLCDENGLVVWAEIPYITMHMKNGRENTLSQMTELVVQNYNHASIAVWGLSNEISAASPVSEDLLENHRVLNQLCHQLDPTRLTTIANVFMLETDSPLLEIPDVSSYNLYFGWYLGELDQNDEFFDEYHEKYPNRCVGLSEYGADANPSYQSPHPERGDYTESYQCVYHEHMLKMIEARPWLWATHVWNLFDFAADGRDEGGKHGRNQKGLVTFDRGLKKDPFYLYKAAWNHKDPFVHLCGSRYVDRTEEITEVKVYSNQNEVELYVDGKLFAAQQGKTVFTFQVPISGEHTLEAKAGECSSTILVRKVEQPNPAYTMPGRSGITNWFDQGELDPTCYSVSDTVEEVEKNPEAAAAFQQAMSQGTKVQGGDMADAIRKNPTFQKILARMTLLSVLKQSGVSQEQVQQLNRVLQGIQKAQEPQN
ncbi:MAG: glycoside hydrolase family 2 TIM barrel-domain containing protein [Acutalibacter sp.]|jgi:beta-galactosidase